MQASGKCPSSLPKFKFDWGTTSLKPALESMGMKDAFVYPTADFSGMEPKRELYVGDVLQKAFVGVDESGAEAAAATAVVDERRQRRTAARPGISTSTDRSCS